MKWKNLSASETLKELNSSINGITNAEAQKRLSKHGKNELVEEKSQDQFKYFLASSWTSSYSY